MSCCIKEVRVRMKSGVHHIPVRSHAPSLLILPTHSNCWRNCKVWFASVFPCQERTLLELGAHDLFFACITSHVISPVQSQYHRAWAKGCANASESCISLNSVPSSALSWLACVKTAVTNVLEETLAFWHAQAVKPWFVLCMGLGSR